MVEVLGSFSIFLVLLTFLLPIMMKAYQEREIMEYKKEALIVLRNEVESYLYDGDPFFEAKEIETTSRSYRLSIEEEDGFTKVCVYWEVPWKEKGNVCDYAKK
ncbi:type II secretion system protein [Schinkia sp. CFF1]